MYAKWTMAPSGYYIGVIEFNNGHYYSYGRTADHLEKNMKVHMYQKQRISATQVHLEQTMSDAIDLQYAHPKFIARYVRPKMNRQPIMVNKVLMTPPTPVTPEEPKQEEPKQEETQKDKEYVTDIDIEKNEMVVYELKEVARYKLRRSALDKA